MDKDEQSSSPLISKSPGSWDRREESRFRRHAPFTADGVGARSKLLLWLCIGQLVLLVISVTALAYAFHLVQSTQQLCVERLSTASPGLDVVKDEWEWRRFNGSVFSDGPYKGSPSGEVMDRWLELTTPVAFSIDHQMLMDIGGSEDSVKIPEDLGGGYMAIFEVHHQLHCLFQLYMNTWPEFYNEDAGNSSSTFRYHLDHCADILRQQLMCNGDVSVIPQNWVKHVSEPTPNFNGLRKCRNYDAIVEWEQEHMVVTPGGKIPKPADAMELEDWP